jgi:hypothetical protein
MADLFLYLGLCSCTHSRLIILRESPEGGIVAPGHVLLIVVQGESMTCFNWNFRAIVVLQGIRRAGLPPKAVPGWRTNALLLV